MSRFSLRMREGIVCLLYTTIVRKTELNHIITRSSLSNVEVRTVEGYHLELPPLFHSLDLAFLLLFRILM